MHKRVSPACRGCVRVFECITAPFLAKSGGRIFASIFKEVNRFAKSEGFGTKTTGCCRSR